MSTLAELRNRLATQGLPLSPQESFNSALEGVRAQGYRRSISLDGTCVYRMTRADGLELKCAIGHCLTDNMIELIGMDGYMPASISTICREYADIKELFSVCGQEFLQDMQVAHDRIVDGAGFEEDMKLMAVEYGLEYSAPLSLI